MYRHQSYVHPLKRSQGGSAAHTVSLELLDHEQPYSLRDGQPREESMTAAANVEMMCAAAEQPHPWKPTVAGYPIVAMYCDQELMGVLRVVEVAEGPAFTWNWKKSDIPQGAKPKPFPPALRENAIIRALLFGVVQSPALKGLTTAHGGQLVITGSHDNHTAQTIAKLVVWSCQQDQATAGGHARDAHLHKRVRIDENEPSVVTVVFPAGLLDKLRTFVGGNFNVVKSYKNGVVRRPGSCFDQEGGAAEAEKVIGVLATTKLLSGPTIFFGPPTTVCGMASNLRNLMAAWAAINGRTPEGVQGIHHGPVAVSFRGDCRELNHILNAAAQRSADTAGDRGRSLTAELLAAAPLPRQAMKEALGYRKKLK